MISKIQRRKLWEYDSEKQQLWSKFRKIKVYVKVKGRSLVSWKIITI